MIGARIFVLPGIVAEAADPASMAAFAIGGVIALLAALSLSELVTGMPKAGGSYYYVNRVSQPLRVVSISFVPARDRRRPSVAS